MKRGTLYLVYELGERGRAELDELVVGWWVGRMSAAGGLELSGVEFIERGVIYQIGLI